MAASMIAGVPYREGKDLLSLIENRTTYTLGNCELNIFETHQEAEKISLVFDDLVLTTMIKGKKVMYLYDQPGFDYLPGESVIVAPHEVMKIDFPDATLDNPTECIALSISAQMIENTFSLLNETLPKNLSTDQWRLDTSYYHLSNNEELSNIIHHFIRIGVNDVSKEKDIIASLALKELLIRLSQTQARDILEKTYKQSAGSNRLAYVVDYIKENIREELSIEQLSDKACLSKSHFSRSFKNELGLSPSAYILKERLKLAKKYLQSSKNQIQEVCFMSGFKNITYFIRAFKQEFGVTPKAFQMNF